MNQFYKTKIVSMARPRSCAPTASQTIQTKLFFFFGIAIWDSLYGVFVNWQ
jgi:hypothetical protein